MSISFEIGVRRLHKPPLRAPRIRPLLCGVVQGRVVFIRLVEVLVRSSSRVAPFVIAVLSIYLSFHRFPIVSIQFLSPNHCCVLV